MDFVAIQVVCEEMTEILQAFLAEIGFDAFLENENGFEASISEKSFVEQELKDTLSTFQNISYSFDKVKKKNWNQLWEENYDPVVICDDLHIRAHFHDPDPKFKYEIVITPKMSFGTGHHSTTTLMLRTQLETDHQGKNVADLGAGTGILSVMACKLGAKRVDACDIEDWAVDNAIENGQINNVDFNMTMGSVEDMPKLDSYELVLANINRNVLLTEIHIYAGMLSKGGTLLLSGFYTEDVDTIVEECKKYDLEYESHKELKNWVCVKLNKK